jgi:hypothetical protein
MYDRYTASGGPAELVEVGVVMKNSHNSLARLGMPSAPVNAGYLPQPFPAATQFAALRDVGAVPYLTNKGRELYGKFLEAPFPRAFVINEAGSAASNNGGHDSLGRGNADLPEPKLSMRRLCR